MLERKREEGRVRKAGRVPTVEEWLLYWLENIARPSLKYKAYCAYRSAVHTHLIPALGSRRIDKVEPEHFERLYAKIIAAGGKPGNAHQVHRTARRAFGVAARRGRIYRNPVELASPPRVEEDEVEPFDPAEIQLLIKAALARRNGVRFFLALSLGTRQGETIGLKWSRLDEANKSLRIAKQLQRQTWEHGCTDPHQCGRRYHKTEPCPRPCKRHSRPCPPPCSPNCTAHAHKCPDRRGGGLVYVDVKSRSGRRGVALPEQLYALLADHREAQRIERTAAQDLWEDGDWMFAQPNGRPIDPRRDYQEWKELLASVGLRNARLHDARHTAATVLLLIGVPERAVMDMMGWSNSAMVKRYQHVTDALRRDIAGRLDGFLWGTAQPAKLDRRGPLFDHD